MSRIEIKPMFVFPGQGAQYPGMGSDLCAFSEAARRVYATASEVLGYDMQELSFRDPEGRLDKTRYTQPALLTHEIACLEVFKELTGGAINPAITAGHSLGEYSALVAGGSLSLENALRLVQRRGEILSANGKGKMVAFKLDADSMRPFVERHFCGIGGCNLPEQTVVGGAEEDLKALVTDVKQTFGSDGVPLNVEGAFHTYLMTGAADAFKAALLEAEFDEPDCRVISNYTGTYHATDPARVKAYLFFQIFYPVRWIWGMHKALSDGVNIIVEFGGGIGSGEGPDTKRPNLAGITKTVLRKFDGNVLYQPAINAATLRDTANLFRALRTVKNRLPPGTPIPEEPPLRLFVPASHGMVLDNSADVLRKLAARGLETRVGIHAQEPEDILARLARSGQQAARAQPVLEDHTAGATPAVLLGEPLTAFLDRLPA